jgi:hypothetical protein
LPIWPGPRVSPALEGVDTLFVHPRAVGGNAEKLLALAAERGVRRVVAPLSLQGVPPGAAARGMVANGLPEAFATALMARYARGAGQPATVADDVEEILGRPARTFAQFVGDHADAFQPEAS